MLDPEERLVLRTRLRRVIDTYYAGRISTFGRACGIGSAVAKYLVNGTHVPQAKTLNRVADGLGLTIAALIDKVNEPEYKPKRVRMREHYNPPPPPKPKVQIDIYAPRPSVHELRLKGLSLSEIAAIVGLSVPGVSRALSRNSSKRQPTTLIFDSFDAESKARVTGLFTLATHVYGRASIARKALGVSAKAFHGRPTDDDLRRLADIVGINVQLLATTTFNEIVFPFHSQANDRRLLPVEVENVRLLIRRAIDHCGGHRLGALVNAAPEHLFNIVGITKRRPGVVLARRLAAALGVPEYDVRTKYIPDEVLHRLPKRKQGHEAPVDEMTAIRVRRDLKSICLRIGSAREAASVLGLSYNSILRIVQGEAPGPRVASRIDEYQRANTQTV